jgi:hypothetical protein
MNVATAATDRPAICAGVIVLGPGAASAIAGAAVEPAVDNDEEVDDMKGLELTTMEFEGVGWMLVDIVNVDVRLIEEDVVDEATVAATVSAVWVGRTASFWPRQTLYADDALSMVGHDEYIHLRASSPSDSPRLLYREHRQPMSSWVVHERGNWSWSAERKHGWAHAGTVRWSWAGSEFVMEELESVSWGKAAIRVGNIVHSLLMWLRNIVVQKLLRCK